jgi:hypothetical protein
MTSVADTKSLITDTWLQSWLQPSEWNPRVGVDLEAWMELYRLLRHQAVDATKLESEGRAVWFAYKSHGIWVMIDFFKHKANICIW